jgi:hypothetical protein
MNFYGHEKRDFLLMTVIVLLGIFLMFLSGQFAIRPMPRWNVNSDMLSNIDPNNSAAKVDRAGIMPLRPEILTPKPWQQGFLTPGPDLEFSIPVPVVIVEPVTRQPTQASPATEEPAETQTQLATATLTLVPTSTLFPNPTLIVAIPTTTFTHTLAPSATFTFTPTPSVTNTATPTATFTATLTPAFTPTFTPAPTFTLTPITPDSWPPEVGTIPNGVIYELASGDTLTLELTLHVPGSSLIFHERPMSPGILMDQIIISISKTGHTGDWYEIFNWGDNEVDWNVSPNMIDLGITEEADNYPIPASFLYSTNGYATGFLITLNGYVPDGEYKYIRFYAPPGDLDGTADIDAIVVLP